MISLGIDAGNHETKVVGLNGAAKHLSCIGEYRELKLKNGHNPGDMVVEYAGKKYFYGSLALRESEFGVSHMGKTKAHHDGLLRILVALHQQEGRDFSIVTGQPIDEHTDEEKRKIIEMLTGPHEITVNGSKRSFTVHRVRVAPEGAAAIWAAPAMGLHRYIDWGSGTINCGTVLDKVYIDKDSWTTSYGVNSTKNNDPAALAEGVGREASKKWNRGDTVIHVGGAAEVMAEHMLPYYPRGRVLRPALHVNALPKVLHPVYVNAVAFYNMARAGDLR